MAKVLYNVIWICPLTTATKSEFNWILCLRCQLIENCSNWSSYLLFLCFLAVQAMLNLESFFQTILTIKHEKQNNNNFCEWTNECRPRCEKNQCNIVHMFVFMHSICANWKISRTWNAIPTIRCLIFICSQFGCFLFQRIYFSLLFVAVAVAIVFLFRSIWSYLSCYRTHFIHFRAFRVPTNTPTKENKQIKMHACTHAHAVPKMEILFTIVRVSFINKCECVRFFPISASIDFYCLTLALLLLLLQLLPIHKCI